MRKLEFWVGLFVLAGVFAIAYLAIQIGGGRLFSNHHYVVKARFNDLGGLNTGSSVEIAGVRVGTVKSITLDAAEFAAIVEITIENTYKLDDDTMASIRTKGIIGDKYIALLPGGSGMPLAAGDLITDTESAVDLEGLISKFAFGSIEKDKSTEDTSKNETSDPDSSVP